MKSPSRPFVPSEVEGHVSTKPVLSSAAGGVEGLDTSGSGGGPIPRHVAIIMDGNGRWAKQRGLPRAAGHRAGAEAVRRALQAAADNGVEVLTIYAFSSENWRRSEEEISDLTALMRFYLDRELKTLEKEKVRLRLIGDYSAFGGELVERLEHEVQKLTDDTIKEIDEAATAKEKEILGK